MSRGEGRENINLLSKEQKEKKPKITIQERIAEVATGGIESMRRFINSTEGKIFSEFMGGLTLLAMSCERFKKQGEDPKKIMEFQRDTSNQIATQTVEEMKEKEGEVKYELIFKVPQDTAEHQRIHGTIQEQIDLINEERRKIGLRPWRPPFAGGTGTGSGGFRGGERRGGERAVPQPSKSEDTRIYPGFGKSTVQP